MKSAIAIAATTLFAEALVFDGHAQDILAHAPVNWVVTGSRSNVVAVFQSSSANSATFPVTASIRFGFASISNIAYNIYLLKPEYGYRISASGQNGTPVPLTAKGSRYGKRFGQAQILHTSKLDSSWRPGYDHKRPYWTAAPVGDVSLSRELPSPSELFKFGSRGSYAMTIELAVFESPLIGNKGNARLVLLPPVRLQLIAEDTP